MTRPVIDWSQKIQSLDNLTAIEYIQQNATSMTDLQLSQALTKACGVKVSKDVIANRRSDLNIEKVGGPNGTVRRHVSESKFPKYDSPPKIESDKVLILPDVQVPYQNSEFINRVLDLCDVWRVRDCILAGDLLENASLTHFDPAWISEKEINDKAIPDSIADELIDLMTTMGRADKDKLRKFIEKRGRKSGITASGAGQEWSEGRIAIREIVAQFDRLIWSLGNHEGRLLKQMASPLLPEDLKRLFIGEDAKVEIAPYYHCIVISKGVEWRVIHPKSAGRDDPQIYASKLLCNVIMAHSHHWNLGKDRSGKYYAISSGACVDERRLPYCSQRDNKGFQHLLGATIIRSGKPWLLGDDTDFDLLKKI